MTGSNKVADATRHTAVAQVVTQVARFGTSIVLARFLTPDQFGIFALALVVSMLVEQFKDMGTGAAVIQRENLDDALINSVFYLNMALGLVLAGGMYLGSHALATALGDARVEPLLEVFALLLVVSASAHIHNALLRRELRFFAIGVVGATSAVLTAVVSIVAAVLGLGYWSPVVGIAVGNVVGTICVWVLGRWRPSLTLSLASLRSIWSYSLHLFGANVLTMVLNQADKIIVSRFLGSAALGIYTLGQRTVTSPMTNVSAVVAEISLPVFSRLQGDHAALRDRFLRVTGVLALVLFPAMVGLAVLADPAVRVVFGAPWLGLIPVIWLLAPAAVVQLLILNGSQLMLATGRSYLFQRMSLVNLVIVVLLELVAVRWGVVGVAAAFAGGTLLLAPAWILVSARTIGLSGRRYLRNLVPQLWVTAVMALATWAAAYGVDRLGAPAMVQLLAGTVVGVAVYGGLMLWRRPPAVADTLAVVSARFRPSASAT